MSQKDHHGFHNEQDLEEHLKNYHQKSPLSEYLKEIVYGGNDGIVTTLAVISGFAGAGGGQNASYSVLAVLLFGFANLFADGTSMGLGNFLSIRSEQAIYKKQLGLEKKEMEDNEAEERQETMYLLKREGYDNEDAQTFVNLLSKNKKFWLEFMMEKELDMHDPRGDNPLFTAIATFISFVVFGFIPIIPYLFGFPIDVTYPYSLVFAGFALIILGTIRFKTTGEVWYKAIFETLLVGGVSSAVAFMVGVFFK